MSHMKNMAGRHETAAARPRVRWAAVGVLVLAVSGLAQADEAFAPAAAHSAGAEPITPIPAPPEADPRKLALGEKLFADLRLSRDGTRSCLTCHDIRTNGADGNPHSRAFDGSELPFNTGTVFNAALSFRLTWEGRLPTLESQAEIAIQSPGVLGSTMDDVLHRLNADAETVHQFQAAYGREPDRTSLLDALATYQRSLLTPGSRFDRWLGGDTTALSAQEQDGYQTFKKLGCISCHQGVNVGGNLFERFGIFDPASSPKREMLRVPSLRNVAVTAPYFHDGRIATLEEAVRRMGRAQLNKALSDQQVDEIVAFLKTLTGNYQGHPLKAPTPVTDASP